MRLVKGCKMITRQLHQTFFTNRFELQPEYAMYQAELSVTTGGETYLPDDTSAVQISKPDAGNF